MSRRLGACGQWAAASEVHLPVSQWKQEQDGSQGDGATATRSNPALSFPIVSAASNGLEIYSRFSLTRTAGPQIRRSRQQCQARLVTDTPTWSPPSKIAAKYLAPYPETRDREMGHTPS